MVFRGHGWWGTFSSILLEGGSTVFLNKQGTIGGTLYGGHYIGGTVLGGFGFWIVDISYLPVRC